ncbi:carbohydrate-binding protein [Streptomyces sp. Ag109_O5-10]|uniref:carbohydrate-binding protein n=1 Tax=Streptomyces sp. Ag109_O5-10 TaxID=1855349 RepID=UPI0008993A77|nr:carbohydrate-binding protein [Streptomyces sp. Ag109_O5-10]SEF16103.1 Right handed beta helix region [Streptomyces sp. Ag109_O5-10]
MQWRHRALAIGTTAATVVTALATALPATAQAAAHTTRYVSSTGSDRNPGTAHRPFRTVQECASAALPGDTCVIASGIYRESIRPARSGTDSARITYRAAPGADVVVDGSDPVTGWAPVTASDVTQLQQADPTLTGSDFAVAAAAGKIYRTDIDLDPSLPGNQLFLDGTMLGEAQWPYPGTDPTRPEYNSADAGTDDTLYDDALTQPDGYWKGARLTSHNWFVSQTGTVTGSRAGSVTATGLSTACVSLSPNQRNLYALTGKLQAFSHAGQWFYDQDAHRLYIWMPDGGSPVAHTVEAKQRNVAVDLSGRSYVSVVGIGVRAATVRTSSTSTHNVLDGIEATYVSHYMDLKTDPAKVTPADPCDVLTAGETTSGILLGGRSNTLRNSRIDYSAGNGVVLSGSGNVVTNNLITRVDYRGSYAAGINVLGRDQTITHNTVINSGRSDINIDNKVAGTTASGHEIAYNDLSDYGNLVVDVGAIYICCQVNLAGTAIHHNHLHDAALFAASAPAPGVYLDLSTYNSTVYDNVAWNRTTYGVVLINPNGGSTTGNRILNNTSGTDRKSVSLFGGTYSDTEVANNIGDADTMEGVSSTNNLPQSAGPQFTDPAAHDFTLTSASPARDYGLVRPPATDGYTDPQPSAGAYQYGAPVWRAGIAAETTTVQAESYADASGVTTHAAGTGTVLGSFDGGDWTRYDNVDFGSGRDLLIASIGSEQPYSGGSFEIRIDSATGPLIGTVTVESTGAWDTYLDQTSTITSTSGTHDVYIKALGTAPGVANIDNFSLARLIHR